MGITKIGTNEVGNSWNCCLCVGSIIEDKAGEKFSMVDTKSELGPNGFQCVARTSELPSWLPVWAFSGHYI
jgi:hypothetical protein